MATEKTSRGCTSDLPLHETHPWHLYWEKSIPLSLTLSLSCSFSLPSPFSFSLPRERKHRVPWCKCEGMKDNPSLWLVSCLSSIINQLTANELQSSGQLTRSSVTSHILCHVCHLLVFYHWFNLTCRASQVSHIYNLKGRARKRRKEQVSFI